MLRPKRKGHGLRIEKTLHLSPKKNKHEKVTSRLNTNCLNNLKLRSCYKNNARLSRGKTYEIEKRRYSLNPKTNFMSGLKTNLLDLGQSFQKLKAMESATHRKEIVIRELERSYMLKGYPEYRAKQMAQDQYNIIHSKNQLT